MPALRRYLREAISGKGYLKPKCRFYYAESRIPYFIPISRKRVVLSLALEDYLIHDYDGNLYRDVPDEAYIPNLVLSRKTLLLSIFCYVLILRFIELWTIIAAVIVRLVFAAIAVIVTGSFYEGVHKMMEAIWIGAALGKVVWKINERLPNKCIRWRNRSRRRGAALCLQRTAFFHSIRRCGRKIRIWPDGFPLKERQSTTP